MEADDGTEEEETEGEEEEDKEEEENDEDDDDDDTANDDVPPPRSAGVGGGLRNRGGAGLVRTRPSTSTVLPSPISSARKPPHTHCGGGSLRKVSRMGEYQRRRPEGWHRTGAYRCRWMPPGSRSWSTRKETVPSW